MEVNVHSVYIRSFRRRTQNLTHLQHVLTCGRCNLHVRACGRVAELGSPLCPIAVSRSACGHAGSGAHGEHSRGPQHQSAATAALPQKERWRIRRGSPQIAARSPDSVQHLQMPPGLTVICISTIFCMSQRIQFIRPEHKAVATNPMEKMTARLLETGLNSVLNIREEPLSIRPDAGRLMYMSEFDDGIFADFEEEFLLQTFQHLVAIFAMQCDDTDIGIGTP